MLGLFGSELWVFQVVCPVGCSIIIPSFEIFSGVADERITELSSMPQFLYNYFMTTNFYDKVAKKFGGYAYGKSHVEHLSKYPNGDPEKNF